MRVTASFIRAPAMVLPAILGSWIVAALLLLVGVGLLMDTLTLRSELPTMTRRLQILQREYAAAPKHPLPSQSQLTDMRERVSALNKVSVVRGWSTSQLLTWLEGHLPQEVHLLALHHKTKEGEALLSAEASNSSALTGFLSQLEKEPAFAEVLLSKQSTRGGEAAPATVQFEIKLRLKP